MCSLKVVAAPGPKPAGICSTKSQAWMCITCQVLALVPCDAMILINLWQLLTLLGQDQKTDVT